MFKKRENVAEIEEGNLLSPKFDNDGLIPVITMCSKTKEILMHGYMNVEALKKTIETKEAHYFSRSRKSIWHPPSAVIQSMLSQNPVARAPPDQAQFVIHSVHLGAQISTRILCGNKQGQHLRYLQ